jgi:hypothetical protein
MDQQGKPLWLSRGVMGPVVSVLALLIGVVGGVQVDAATQAIIVDQVVGLVSAAVVLIGSVVGIWGRIKARQPIK